MRRLLASLAALAAVAAAPSASAGQPQASADDPRGDAGVPVDAVDVVRLSVAAETADDEVERLVFTLSLAGAPVPGNGVAGYRVVFRAGSCTQILSWFGSGRSRWDCTGQGNVSGPVDARVDDRGITWTVEAASLARDVRYGVRLEGITGYSTTTEGHDRIDLYVPDTVSIPGTLRLQDDSRA